MSEHPTPRGLRSHAAAMYLPDDVRLRAILYAAAGELERVLIENERLRQRQVSLVRDVEVARLAARHVAAVMVKGGGA